MAKKPIVKEVYVMEVKELDEPDLVVQEDGCFKYKGRILDHISTDSKHGKLLKLFCQLWDERFVSDELMLRALIIENYRDWGFIIRNLKNALKKDGLEPVIRRRRDKEGYKLVRIKELDTRYS